MPKANGGEGNNLAFKVCVALFCFISQCSFVHKNCYKPLHLHSNLSIFAKHFANASLRKIIPWGVPVEASETAIYARSREI